MPVMSKRERYWRDRLISRTAWARMLVSEDDLQSGEMLLEERRAMCWHALEQPANVRQSHDVQRLSERAPPSLAMWVFPVSSCRGLRCRQRSGEITAAFGWSCSGQRPGLQSFAFLHNDILSTDSLDRSKSSHMFMPHF